MKHTELTLAAVEEALTFIPAEDRELWVKVGMALKDEYGEGARDVWLGWSQSADNYNKSAAVATWKSLKTSGGIKIGSLIYEAKQFGWSPRRNSYQRVTNEEYAAKQAERERRRAQDEEAARERSEKAAQRAQQLWDSAVPAEEHPYLTRKGIQAHGTRILDVWERRIVDRQTGEEQTVSVLNALLVPVMIGTKTISTVQAVFPKFSPELERDKDYLPGGAKAGGYYKLGSINRSTLRIVICEGFATGATIHEATGETVIIAFDSGNLLPVAQMIREKMPDVEIIIAGDNDLWTKGNPGARKANAAAFAVHGRVILPSFDDLEGNPTDFNDLRDHELVSRQIASATQPQDPELYRPECLVEEPQKPEPEPEQSAGEDDQAPILEFEPFDIDAPFRILGYDHERYYLFQNDKKQLLTYSAGSFTDVGFLQLAGLDYWEFKCPSSSGFDKKMAINGIIRTAHKRGIYDPTKTRGRGAWVDKGRIVMHLGDQLIVDGVRTDITQFASGYVYELDRALPKPSLDMMNDDEGRSLLELAKLFRWTKPASAPMLAGWCALAPLCGALAWRPHIWLTGGAGTGKSTLLNEYVHTLMNGMDIFAQGNSTEAGIRQTLNQDALPVLFDESEKNTERERLRVDGILALIRQASTESAARTLKGTAFGDSMAFHIRSMFCLASIQVGIEHQADYERLAVLALRPKREQEGQDNWQKIKDMLYVMKRDEDLPSRLFARSLRLLPTTLKNIEVFAAVGAQKFGSQRDGDQYGTLMAGAWSLISQEVATQPQAMAMFDSYDWAEYMEHADSDDSDNALRAVMGSHIRLPGGATVTVHELVLLSQHRQVDGVDVSMTGKNSEAMLARYGIKVCDRNEFLLFANGHPALAGLVSHTQFAADLRGLLLRVKGAVRWDKAVWFAGGTMRAIGIPLSPLLDGYDIFSGDDDYHDSSYPF